MIDYVNTEIVVYADDIELYSDFDFTVEQFESYYPDRISTVDNYYTIHSISFDEIFSEFSLSFYRELYISKFPLDWHDTFSYEIFVVYRFNSNDKLDGQRALYYRTSYPTTVYLRLDTFFDPYQEFVPDGEDIYFLFNFGQALVEKNLLLDLFTVRIGDFNLLYFLFGAGFVFYATYLAVKWFIPL